MASIKTFQLIATKLAIGDNEKVLSKAAEYSRILESKSVAGSNMTDTAKVVVCLDLAASFYGVDLEMKSAIKYSGLKSPSYAASRKMVETLVEHNVEKIVVPSLCLTLQCTAAQSLAEKILAEYQKQSKMVVDLSLPQYVCMAVYQACRLNKVKVSKSKLIEKSRLRSAQWAKLAAEWTVFTDGKFAAPSDVKKRGRPRKVVVVEEDTPMDVEDPKNDDEEPQTEPYEDWRRRMLEQAYRELKEMQNLPKYTKELEEPKEPKEPTPRKEPCVLKFKDLDSPRRSPRKTPQKISPYKNSPKKIQGVRLLFPM